MVKKLKKRGQPKRHPIDSLRTKVWFAQASEWLGGKTAYWIWVNIDNKIGSLSKWSKYRTGDRIPKSMKGSGSVERLAEEYPGTDTIFHALFWTVLKHGQASAEAINKELSSLGGNLSILPKTVLEGGFIDNIDEDGLFPFDDILNQLANQCDSDFYTLQAIVLLLALANNGHSDHWNAFCDLYRNMLPNFILGVDTPFKAEILNQIDKFALRREFPTFNDSKPPKPVEMSWRDEIPRFQNVLSEHYSECFKVQRKYLAIDNNIFTGDDCERLAAKTAHRVCKDDYLMMNSRDLWKPISWEFAKLLNGHFNDLKDMGKNYWAHLEKEIRGFLDPSSRPKDYDDSFSISFQG